MSTSHAVTLGGVALALLLILVDLRIMRKIRRERAALESARRPKVQKGRIYVALMMANKGHQSKAIARLVIAESETAALGEAYQAALLEMPKADGFDAHGCAVAAVPQDVIDSAAGAGAGETSAATLRPSQRVLA